MTCPSCGNILDGIFLCQRCEREADLELRARARRETPKGFNGEGWIAINTPRAVTMD